MVEVYRPAFENSAAPNITSDSGIYPQVFMCTLKHICPSDPFIPQMAPFYILFLQLLFHLTYIGAFLG